MSVNRHGAKWRVQWRSDDGTRRTRSFETQHEAEQFDSELRRAVTPQRDKARDWLRSFLADGPRHSRAIMAAAEAEAVAKKSTLHALGRELGVERTAGWWSLNGDPPPPEAGRACVRCQRLLSVEDFPMGRRGRSSTCQPCTERRERLRQDGGLQSVAAANQAVDYAPDPGPARALRQELERRRDQGELWEQAWPAAQKTALADLPTAERKSWRSAFKATRGAWHRGYLGRDVAEHPLFLRERERVAA